MSKQTYTLAELQAMPNDGLDALAVEMRGWKFSAAGILEDENGQEVRQKDCVVFKLSTASESYPYFWTPATDRNQSGKLLEWLIANGWRGAAYYTSPARIEIWHYNYGKNVQVAGWNARAETIAFCAAMLATAGRLK